VPIAPRCGQCLALLGLDPLAMGQRRPPRLFLPTDPGGASPCVLSDPSSPKPRFIGTVAAAVATMGGHRCCWRNAYGVLRRLTLRPGRATAAASADHCGKSHQRAKASRIEDPFKQHRAKIAPRRNRARHTTIVWPLRRPASAARCEGRHVAAPQVIPARECPSSRISRRAISTALFVC